MTENTIKLVLKLSDTYIRDCFKYSAIYSYKDKRFKISFENSNGKILGFDSKHSLAVFNKANDKWNYLADINDLQGLTNGDITLNYYTSETVQREGLKHFIAACKKYIKALYD